MQMWQIEVRVLRVNVFVILGVIINIRNVYLRLHLINILNIMVMN